MELRLWKTEPFSLNLTERRGIRSAESPKSNGSGRQTAIQSISHPAFISATTRALFSPLLIIHRFFSPLMAPERKMT
ncbi:hypothetical protein HZ326_3050 [Fusarium oxysporum f. sp. albedinis]|nr:hypothetical protein HZ326_3050 [Fusarium oxysporum f. sp. albedinis]